MQTDKDALKITPYFHRYKDIFVNSLLLCKVELKLELKKNIYIYAQNHKKPNHIS